MFDNDGHLGVSAMSEGVVQIVIGATPGDLDGDGDVDLDDWAGFAECMTGADGGVADGCGEADLTGDGFVDLMDVATFQLEFSSH
jgi:hypothetical protein